MSDGLDKMVSQILKEYNGSKENVISRVEQLEFLKNESEGRVKAIQWFVGRLDDFLTDTKSKLFKMVASFNDTESRERQQLGPLIPVGDMTQDRFSAAADLFVENCTSIALKLLSHWEEKGPEEVKKSSHKLMEFLKEQIKPKDMLKQENIALIVKN